MTRSLAILFSAVMLSVPVARSQGPQQAPRPEEKTPAAKPRVPRIHIGGNAAVKLLSKKVSPVYPFEARQGRIQGTVRLHVIIGTDGGVVSAEVVSGHPLLTESSIHAVRQWQYKPSLFNGEPAEVDTTVDIIYSLGAPPPY
ncbi:MAG TPA: energy transducer TonB [Candidatus Acidoferrum sp.]|jgi:protein TonB